MKTLEEIGEYQTQCIDGRDITRICRFLTAEQVIELGYKFNDKESEENHEVMELTEEAVLDALSFDLGFAFEKAMGKRGLSASMMHNVIKMWMWVLDDDLADEDMYAQYGLPYLKAVAIKYDLPNPIGDDSGDEGKYAS
jgi:hypothetical protein